MNATDYAIPEFDRVGMQQVPLAHFSNPTLSEFGSLVIDHIGYAPRYIDYKTDVDSSVGAFKGTLNSWVISYGNASLAKQLGNVDSNNQPSPSAAPLNYTMFKVNPDSLNLFLRLMLIPLLIRISSFVVLSLMLRLFVILILTVCLTSPLLFNLLTLLLCFQKTYYSVCSCW